MWGMSSKTNLMLRTAWVLTLLGGTVDFKVTLLARKGQSVLPIYSDRKQGEREFIANRDSKYRVLQKGFNSLVVEMI